MNGWPKTKLIHFQDFFLVYDIQDQIKWHQDILLKGEFIIVPRNLREINLKEIHNVYRGIKFVNRMHKYSPLTSWSLIFYKSWKTLVPACTLSRAQLPVITNQWNRFWLRHYSNGMSNTEDKQTNREDERGCKRWWINNARHDWVAVNGSRLLLEKSTFLWYTGWDRIARKPFIHSRAHYCTKKFTKTNS